MESDTAIRAMREAAARALCLEDTGFEADDSPAGTTLSWRTYLPSSDAALIAGLRSSDDINIELMLSGADGVAAAIEAQAEGQGEGG